MTKRTSGELETDERGTRCPPSEQHTALSERIPRRRPSARELFLVLLLGQGYRARRLRDPRIGGAGQLGDPLLDALPLSNLFDRLGIFSRLQSDPGGDR